MDITPDTEDQGKELLVEDMGEPKGKEEIVFDSLMKAINDLAKDKKDMLNEIKMQNWERSTQNFLFGEISGAS